MRLLRLFVLIFKTQKALALEGELRKSWSRWLSKRFVVPDAQAASGDTRNNYLNPVFASSLPSPSVYRQDNDSNRWRVNYHAHNDRNRRL